MAMNLITGYDIDTDECGETHGPSPSWVNPIHRRVTCVPTHRRQQLKTELMYYNTQW